MNSNSHTHALARFPNLANVKVIVNFTINGSVQSSKHYVFNMFCGKLSEITVQRNLNMKVSRIIFVILEVVFAIIAVAILVRWITNRDSTELLPQPSNVEYTRWELPEGAKARLGKGSINDIKFSSDGTRFAVATTIGVWMYDAKTGKEISLFKGERQDIKGIAFSAGGSVIVGANSTGGIPRWDTITGELHTILADEKVKTLKSAVFSEDGAKLVSVGRHDKIHVWNLGDETTSPSITDIDPNFKNGQLTVTALSPDSRFLATAIHEWKKVYPIQMWNADTGSHLLSLTGHSQRIKSLALSPDGKTLASCDYESIHLWDVDTATRRATFKAPGTGFSVLAFSPNGKLLASGCSDGSVRLWNATAEQRGLGGKVGQYLSTLMLKKHKNEVSALAFSPDGKMLLTGSDDGTIRAWNTTTGKQQFTCRGHLDAISDIAASKEGNTLTSVHSWRNTQIQHWDIGNRNLLSVSFLKRTIPAAISPDATTLAMMDMKGKNKLRLWDVSKKRFRSTLEGHEYPSNALNFVFAFSSDEKRLASAALEQYNIIHMWNIPIRPQTFFQKLFSSSKAIRPQEILEGRIGVVRILAFSPNGKILASGGDSATIRLWDVETGSTILTLTGRKQGIKALTFSPDGKVLTSADYDTIYFWNVTTGKQLRTNPTEAGVNVLQFSADGKVLVSGDIDGIIQLWDARTYRLLSSHIGHTNRVNALVFIEDGKTLASASRDGTILLWDWEKIAQVNN